MKKIVGILLTVLSISYASALTCTDLPKNLMKTSESSSVLLLQNFLKDKGYLQAKPNGYFGQGTLAAVKLYQKSSGIVSTGNVFSLTRTSIKRDSCTTPSSSVSSSATVNVPITPPDLLPVDVVTLSESEKNILTRSQDVTMILKALYAYAKDTNKYLVLFSDTPIEICAPTATTTCDTLIDLSPLVPNFISKIPIEAGRARENGAGYTIRRNENNGFTVSSQFNKDSASQITATCYFGDGCKTSGAVAAAQTIATPPMISSIDRIALISGGTTSKPFIIRGSGFSSSSNTILFTQNMTKKVYTITTSAPSVDGKTISIDSSFINALIPCGAGCIEPLPSSTYGVSVKNSAGESNSNYLDTKGVTTSSVTARADSSITPNSSNIKIGTITLSSNTLVNLKSFSLTASGATMAAAKITKYTLKETTSNTTFTGGSSVVFSNIDLAENQTKIFEVYIDVGNVLSNEAGSVVFSSTFTLKDYLSGNDILVGVKDFSASISY